MGIRIKSAIPTKYAEAAQTTQYTATLCSARIDKFTATNVTGANQTFTVNIVPSGQTAGAANVIVKTRQIAPNECYTFPEIVGRYLDTGDFISTLPSAASAFIIGCSVTEFTD